jgi:hypothetical protein
MKPKGAQWEDPEVESKNRELDEVDREDIKYFAKIN